MNKQEKHRKTYWKPVTFELLLLNYSLKDSRFWILITGWLLTVIGALVITLFLVPDEWLRLEGGRSQILQFFLFNPALIIGVLLFFWIGFEWGFIPVFLCSFVIGFFSGMPWWWALIFGMSFLFGLVICAMAYQAFKIPYNLRSFKSVAFYVSISFISSIGSSLGAFIWSFSHRLTAYNTLTIWKGWWSGTFIQALIIIAPMLWLFSGPIEKLKSEWFEFGEPENVSLKWVFGAVASITVALSLFIFSGKFLGEMRVEEVMATQKAVSVLDIVNALESFEIISWISIGIIIVTGYGAFNLVGGWNKHLAQEVEKRTKELNRSQQKLKVSLDEKELLLREIHHRVKNNMALVSALLELQEQKSKHNDKQTNFRTVRSRIKSMAVAHKVLYENTSFSDISIRNYVERIGRLTHKSFGGGNTKIELHLDMEDARLKMSQSIPLGLFVNEVLINAYKHAFRGMDKGDIWLESEVTEGVVNLTIQDNGVGLPEEAADLGSRSLGMSLIRRFAKQLKADLEIDSKQGEGTSYSLVFEVE